MAIASASDFVVKGILRPIQDIFVLIYGMLEAHLTAELPPEYPNFLYGVMAMLMWIIKFLAAVMGVTAGNETLVLAFNDTLRQLSINSTTFFGNITGESGMAYIAKHAYLNLTTNKPLAHELSADFFRALKSLVEYISKTLEFL